MSDWLVTSTMELGLEIDLLSTGSSASVVKLEITSSLDGKAMFDNNLYEGIIRRSYFGGSAIPSISLDMVAAFELFCSSAFNLLIL